MLTQSIPKFKKKSFAVLLVWNKINSLAKYHHYSFFEQLKIYLSCYPHATYMHKETYNVNVINFKFTRDTNLFS